MKISVVIHTYNAEEFLDRVLESVKGFDEIVICDMYSTDRTLEIANKHHCKVVFHENVGFADPARTYSISQASHEWVFMVDADELVPTVLREYLYYTIQRRPDIGGLRIPRKNYQMGRFMHSAYPDYILRFFKKENTIWPATVHSQPIIDGGKIFDIPSKRKDLAFIHLSNETIRQTINKMNTYTDFETERRQHKNYGVFSLIFEPLLRFLRFYVFKGGFRDGIPGLIWASEYAYYKFITIAKVIESKVTKEDWDKDLKE